MSTHVQRLILSHEMKVRRTRLARALPEEMILTVIDQPTNRPSRALSVALWGTQGALAAFFIYAGASKLTMPADQLATMGPWTAGNAALAMVTGLVDLAGGIGILAPALTRILPGLTVLAALGLVVLQVLALGFHLSRGEVVMAPMNLILIALSAFVLWGRGKAAPIAPRL
jgi:hypothetical protein